jgi:hypothetical protein
MAPEEIVPVLLAEIRRLKAADADILAWQKEAEAEIARLRKALEEIAKQEKSEEAHGGHTSNTRSLWLMRHGLSPRMVLL